MKLRYAYTLPALAALLILSGFSSEGTYFPAPIKEPVAAVYLNVSSTGIYDESTESEKACTEITDAVNNICNLRSISNNSEPTQKYKELSLNFLQNSIISGFLKIEELFSNKGISDNMPSKKINKSDLNVNILDLLVKVEMISSKSEGRRLMEQNGISINQNKETNVDRMITENDFKDGFIIVQKGKKNFLKIEL